MSSPQDFVGMMRVVGWASNDSHNEETVCRYLCTLAKAIEERSNVCPHDGTRLKPWEPMVFEDGMEVGRETTGHKWCTGCCNVLYNRLLAYMNVPDRFRA
jgi:hypothetical protein